MGLSTILLSSIIHNGSRYYQFFLIVVIAILIYSLKVNLRDDMFKNIKIKKFLKKTEEYFKLKDWDNVLLFCEEILNLDSKNKDALYYKSYILFHKKRYSESLDLINFLLNYNKTFDYLVLKGRISIIQKNYDEGLKCYKESLDMDTFDIVGYLDEITYFGDPIRFKDNKKMNEISLALCDFYLERDDDVYVSYFKGHALYNLGRFDESLNAFDHTLEIDPDFETAYSTKSEILFKLGRYDEALDFINKGLELFPDSSLNCNKSYFLYHLERYDEALDSINKCLDCSSDEDDIELKEKIESKLNNS